MILSTALGDDAGGGQLVAQGVGAGPVLGCAGLGPLVEQSGDEMVERIHGGVAPGF